MYALRAHFGQEIPKCKPRLMSTRRPTVESSHKEIARQKSAVIDALVAPWLASGNEPQPFSSFTNLLNCTVRRGHPEVVILGVKMSESWLQQRPKFPQVKWYPTNTTFWGNYVIASLMVKNKLRKKNATINLNILRNSCAKMRFALDNYFWTTWGHFGHC